MSGKTYKSAVALIPPKEAWGAIQEIRQRHDEQVRRWMPHINLLYPFREREDFEQLIPRFVEVLRTVEPFEVTLAGSGFFKHKGTNYTFYLKPEPNERLVSLQHTLMAVTPNCRELLNFQEGFVPHLSVGQVHSKRVFKNLDEKLRALPPITFTADHISLIAREDPPDDVFKVINEIYFQ